MDTIINSDQADASRERDAMSAAAASQGHLSVDDIVNAIHEYSKVLKAASVDGKTWSRDHIDRAQTWANYVQLVLQNMIDGTDEGTVDELLPEKGLVRVLVTIFGRQAPVELEEWQIIKTEDA